MNIYLYMTHHFLFLDSEERKNEMMKEGSFINLLC